MVQRRPAGGWANGEQERRLTRRAYFGMLCNLVAAVGAAKERIGKRAGARAAEWKWKSERGGETQQAVAAHGVVDVVPSGNSLTARGGAADVASPSSGRSQGAGADRQRPACRIPGIQSVRGVGARSAGWCSKGRAAAATPRQRRDSRVASILGPWSCGRARGQTGRGCRSLGRCAAVQSNGSCRGARRCEGWI